MKLFVKSLLVGVVFTTTLANAYERIVVLSGDVGDIVTALGDAKKVVGRDNTNRNPALAHAKSIGTHRNLTPEPIVALKPDLVLGSYMVQPPTLYKRLNSLKIKAVNVAPTESAADYVKAITTIGQYLGKEQQAKKLSSRWQQGMATKKPTKVRYLLSYDGRIVAGKGTVGDELIKRAGGVNAVNIQGLKPISREGWLAAKADVIIIAKHNQATLGTISEFIKRPEISANPAAKKGKVYYWPANDFLRYGLDSPEIVSKLHALAK
ncbi:ABC transporter substrate-binding protein [Moraxella bovis]|uniref:heme/hemin ABC transporter substrate-binding protein n=1 Tax=Moraxella bovis TaxID=476 RepID=UPI002227C45E|nr:ABC transporter substrate-binding protein [Moraxella bovis]UYZ69263.1 ABC transporter substrate-binding protein [Moraxella bovis]UYZ71637.1 ABC transporter substrate-binding protein [Moraxella bovis]UYZ72449.1 ABC transporter substrate-binding protein [Moraxella bovis]UZA14932.1 ABC transporter substrate-binding protein [Moraxella bovis]UZA26707.1 ABC transporter substrate-binding protein [Moraxella bovis]